MSAGQAAGPGPDSPRDIELLDSMLKLMGGLRKEIGQVIVGQEAVVGLVGKQQCMLLSLKYPKGGPSDCDSWRLETKTSYNTTKEDGVNPDAK